MLILKNNTILKASIICFQTIPFPYTFKNIAFLFVKKNSDKTCGGESRNIADCFKDDAKIMNWGRLGERI